MQRSQLVINERIIRKINGSNFNIIGINIVDIISFASHGGKKIKYM